MSTPSFSGAIDLSGLSAQTTVTPPAPVQPQIPDGAIACEVPGGCNLVVMGDREHTDITDCLVTCFPYVERYFQTREASIEVAEEYHKAVTVTRQVLLANQRLLEENDSLKAQLRDARKGTPAAEKHVLAGAADLAASMKANFGPKEDEEEVPVVHSLTETCKRCGQNDTDPYETDGVPYLWCRTCQDDAE